MKLILLLIDPLGEQTQHEIIDFPDRLSGFQAFGILKHLGEARCQTALDEIRNMAKLEDTLRNNALKVKAINGN